MARSLVIIVHVEHVGKPIMSALLRVKALAVYLVSSWSLFKDSFFSTQEREATSSPAGLPSFIWISRADHWFIDLSRFSAADFFLPDGYVRDPQVAARPASMQGTHGPSGFSGRGRQYPCKSVNPDVTEPYSFTALV